MDTWKEKKLDVSALEPPEPLTQAVSTLKQLATREFLRMCHRREPCLLYPILEEQGFLSHTQQRADGMVEILIWHAEDGQTPPFLPRQNEKNR